MVKLGDASYVARQVEMLRSDGPRDYADPDIARYPFLLARVVALFPDTSRIGPDETLDLPELLRRAGAPRREIRLASVFFGLLLVPGTWFLARRFLGDAWALLAAAFTATSLLHVDFSAQAPPHALVTTMILFALLSALHLRRRGDVSAYLLAGLFSGLAVASLQSGACVLPAVGAAVLLRERREGRASAWWILATLAIVAGFVRWSYPFHFVGSAGELSVVDQGGEDLFILSGHRIYLDEFDGHGFASILHTLVCFDPILLLASILGAVFFATRCMVGRVRMRLSSVRDLPPLGQDLLVVLAQAVPYFLVLGIYARSFERFLMPLLPVLACAGAFGVRSAIEASGRRRQRGGHAPLRRGTVLALSASFPLLAAIPALRLADVRAAPSTQDRVAEWIESNVSADERIVVVPQMDLPLLAGDAALAEYAKKPNRSDWMSLQSRLRPAQLLGPRFDLWVVPGIGAGGVELLQRDPLAYFTQFGARYVVLGLIAEPQAGVLERARVALQKHARLVLRVSPERIDSGGSVAVVTRHPDLLPSDPIFQLPYGFWAFDSRCMGRSIEVYRLE
jgi:hypothetical protein